MRLYKSTLISSAALALPFLLFIWFACAADRAMDKSGLGDVESFQHLSAITGLFFWLDILVFLILLSLIFFKKWLSSFQRAELANVCKIYIVLAPILYLVILFWSFR